MNANEMVNRYIYAVTQKLPEKQRADIEKELRGLIEDMLEERAEGAEGTTEQVEKVLLELGNPSVLADQYRGYKHYLISPEMFSFYWTVMKIVLFSIGIAMTVVFAIEVMMGPARVLDHFVDYIVNMINTLVQGFAWVTISFAIMEYSGVNAKGFGSNAAEKVWTPSMLVAIPDSSTQIKKSDPIGSIIFTILFLVVFTFSLELLGVHTNIGGEGHETVFFFDNEVFRSYLPFIWAVFALTIARDIFKLVAGQWTVKLAVFSIGLSWLFFILALILFTDQAIWNPNFVSELKQTLNVVEDSETILKIWNWNKEIWIYAIGLVTIIETVSISWKLYRARGRV